MATTDILPFATGVGANVETQTAYAADSTTSLGFSAGTAASVKLNKVWRQSSFMAAGLANFIVNRGISVPDDGNLANLVAEFEASLDAYLSKNIAGGVSVILDPILEANYPIINLTGALTANINLIVPTAPGKWIIANNTTGAFTVTVKTAAGTGVVATQGTANQYYCDGTNVYSVIAGITQTQADARYAALLGNTANKFSVAAGVATTDAVNVGQAIAIRTANITPVLVAAGSVYNVSHTLGYIPFFVNLEFVNLVAEQGYSVGDVIIITEELGTYATPLSFWKTVGNIGFVITSSTTIQGLNKTTGAAFTPTTTSWAYRFVVR
jgi:hypothetical protein